MSATPNTVARLKRKVALEKAYQDWRAAWRDHNDRAEREAFARIERIARELREQLS